MRRASEFGVVEGGACKVTGGPNDGKTGTYTIDENGEVWCEGSWGGTQCSPGKCEDAAAKANVFDFADRDGKGVFETDGFYQKGPKRLVRFKAQIDAQTGAVRNFVDIPVDIVDITELQKSESKFDRMLADALKAYFGGEPTTKR